MTRLSQWWSEAPHGQNELCSALFQQRGRRKMSSFEEKRAVGERWERYVGECLVRNGFYVLYTCEFRGNEETAKAPRLISPRGHGDLIMPDIFRLRDGHASWVEVKYLSKPKTMLPRYGRWNSMIDTRHLDHYEAVQRESGLPVIVIFVLGHEREVRYMEMVNRDYVTCHTVKSTGKTFLQYDRLMLCYGLFEELEKIREGKEYETENVNDGPTFIMRNL